MPLEDTAQFYAPTQEQHTTSTPYERDISTYVQPGLDQLHAEANDPSSHSERPTPEMSQQERDEQFALWETSLKHNPETNFVLGNDAIDPNSPMFQSEQPLTPHGQVAPASPAHAEHAPGHFDMTARIEALGGPGIIKDISQVTTALNRFRDATLEEANR